jgi:glycosyltransferase involved in cell wall biosynthesis
MNSSRPAQSRGHIPASPDNPPPLSVVMPVRNGMPYVAQSIESILGQSFGDFEFVIGDDGSSDGTPEVLLESAQRDSRIRPLRREKGSGLAASANWVVSEARAQLIAVAHADDLWHPDRLAREIAVLREMPQVDLVGTLWNGIDEKGRHVRPGDYWKLIRKTPLAAFSHSSIMFRKAAFAAVGGYRPEADYWEDLDLYLRIAARGRVVIIPDTLSTVRHSRVSTKFRTDQAVAEQAFDLMYRATGAYWRGFDHRLVTRPAKGQKLHPLSFVTFASTLLWAGLRPHVFRRMWRHGDLHCNSVSIHALLWAAWGAISPKSLRFVLRTLLHVRNMIARPMLRGKAAIEWRPRQQRD